MITDIQPSMSPKRFFISYAHGDPKDEGLAVFLQQGLSRAGHDVFIDVAMPLGTLGLRK